MLTETPAQDAGAQGGLYNSLRRLAATLLAMGRTRLELLSVEIEEERERLSSMLLWTLVALFCAAWGVALVTVLIMVVFWDTHRLRAIGILALLFLGGAILAARLVQAKARSKPRLFATSLGELAKDQQQIGFDE
ncbi:MAG: phage holin family protein [Pseudomonadota bacterium]